MKKASPAKSAFMPTSRGFALTEGVRNVTLLEKEKMHRAEVVMEGDADIEVTIAATGEDSMIRVRAKELGKRELR